MDAAEFPRFDRRRTNFITWDHSQYELTSLHFHSRFVAEFQMSQSSTRACPAFEFLRILCRGIARPIQTALMAGRVRLPPAAPFHLGPGALTCVLLVKLVWRVVAEFTSPTS